jgi:hypothetical protein
MSSSKSGFKAMSWSIRTDGLLDPRPRWSNRRQITGRRVVSGHENGFFYLRVIRKWP